MESPLALVTLVALGTVAAVLPWPLTPFMTSIGSLSKLTDNRRGYQ